MGCHDALRALRQHLDKNEVENVLDIDLANLFCIIDRSILMKMLQEKIQDKRLLRYIARMFKAGILSEGELIVQEEGIVQGSCASPVLANIFAHVWTSPIMQEKNNINSKKIKMQSCIRLIVK